MAKYDSFCESPFEGIAGKPPAGNKGGPGEYDGIKGYPGRTGSSNGVPEKFVDKTGLSVPDKDYGTIATPGKSNP